MSDKVAYLASGVLSIRSPLPSARTEAYAPAAPASLGLWSTYTTQAQPNTGNLIEGFKWDGRYWTSDSDDNSSQTLPTNWDATISGISQPYFQSGIGSGQDLELDHIEDRPSSGLFYREYNPWAPVVRHGYYYDYNEEAYLYSDDSEVVYPIRNVTVTGIANQYSLVPLLSVPKVGVPVSATRYNWNNEEGKYEIDLSVRKVSEFTGVRVSGYQRASTWSDQKKTILWDYVDSTSPEFMVVDSGRILTTPTAIFNQQYSLAQPPTSSGSWEITGYSTGGSNQQFHLAYSPIDLTVPVEVHSFSTVSGAHTIWTPIPSGSYTSTPSGVKIDYDLGILTFGDLSTSGVYNVPATGHAVAARYNSSLRVEYEPEYLTDLVTGYEANLNPINRTTGKGYVYLGTRANDAVAITLSANAPQIQTNLFGPVNIGNAVVPVIATVTDARDLPVESATVNISITSVPSAGRFGSFGGTAVALTNHLGQGKAYYNPPLNIDEMGEVITASGYARTADKKVTSLLVKNLLLSNDVKNLTVYEVLTGDPTQGYFNPQAGAIGSASQIADYYQQYFTNENIYGPTGLSSGTHLTTSSGIAWEELHRQVWNLTQLNLFNTSALNAQKVLCATYDGNAFNPHTFKPGAVAPLQPSGILPVAGSGYNVVFDTSHYEMPVPSGSYGVGASGLVYGYFVASPTIVNLQASTYNTRLGQTFYSNTIQLKVVIPSYMNGMWYVDAINQNGLDEISPLLASGVVIGSGIPLGFRLRSSSVSLAGALNGLTFLDVNPTSAEQVLWDANTIVASGGYH